MGAWNINLKCCHIPSCHQAWLIAQACQRYNSERRISYTTCFSSTVGPSRNQRAGVFICAYTGVSRVRWRVQSQNRGGRYVLRGPGSISNCPAKVCLNSSMKQDLCGFFSGKRAYFSGFFRCAFFFKGLWMWIYSSWRSERLRTPKSGLISPGKIACSWWSHLIFFQSMLWRWRNLI